MSQALTSKGHATPRACLSVSIPLCMGAVAVAATFVLDTSDVLLAIMGALLYCLLQRQGFDAKKTKAHKEKLAPKCQEEKALSSDEDRVQPRDQDDVRPARHSRRQILSRTSHVPPPRSEQAKPHVVPKEDHRMPSAMPVAPVKLTTSSWDGQVQELVWQVSPVPSSYEMVDRLVHIVTRAIEPSLPGALIQGFMTSNPLSAKAFAVAVPEVDVVLEMSPELLRRVIPNGQQLNAKQVQKAAIRWCTDMITSSTDIKFRRSAFQSEEPKVTFIAPVSLDIAGESFGVNFSVNTSTPSRSVALMNECAKLEPRAKDLILLVRRWARDRGISHAAKGNLPPYAWVLLCVYFLQVGVEDEGPLLPSMIVKDGAIKKRKRMSPKGNVGERPVSSLFKEFIEFYDSKYKWRTEVASVRLGSRDCERPPQAVPFVEDPFDVDSNAASCVNSIGLGRLREEFARASKICAREKPSLEELLEIWAPPEEYMGKDANSDDCWRQVGADVSDWRRAGGARQAASCTRAPPRQIKAVQAGLLTGSGPVSLRLSGSVSLGQKAQ